MLLKQIKLIKILPSTSEDQLSYNKRHDRSYGQNKRYVSRCFNTILLFLIFTSNAYALPDSNSCGVNQLDPDLISFLTPDGPGGVTFSSDRIGDSTQNPLPSSYDVYCLTTGTPDLGDTFCGGSNPFIYESNFFLTIHNGSEKCSYEITLDNVANTAVGSIYIEPAPLPTAVPVLTPLGYIITIFGLLWISRRGKITLLSRK